MGSREGLLTDDSVRGCWISTLAKINLDKNALELVDFCSKFLKNIFMAQVEGQGVAEKTPFATRGLREVLKSRGDAAEVVRNTEVELRQRVQAFLQSKIGECRRDGDNSDGKWNLGDLGVKVEGENVVISGVSYYQYGKLGGKHQTGIHIIPLLEGVGLTVSRQSDAHHAPLVIRVPLAEFSRLTEVEDEGAYGAGDDCGVAALAAHQMANRVGGQAMEAVGFPVAAAGPIEGLGFGSVQVTEGFDRDHPAHPTGDMLKPGAGGY